MPRQNEVILDRALAKFEASRGVLESTMTRVVPMRLVMSYDHPLASIPDMSGTRSARRTPVFGRPNVGLTGTEVGTYQDMPWHLQMALKGGVAGVAVPGAVGAFEYEFIPSQSVDDLKTATFQLGDPGNKYTIAQVMANSFTIRCDGDSTDEPAWMYEVEYLARNLETLGAFTNVASHAREAIIAPGTKVYIDDASGDFGDTQIVGKIINFSVTGNNAGHLKGFLEDEDEFGPDSIGLGERVFDAQLTMEFDDDAEFANYRSNVPVQRKIRLHREGSEIVTGQNMVAELDIAGYWSSWSPGDRDGNKTATFGLAAYVDDVLGYDFAARFINDLAVLP